MMAVQKVFQRETLEVLAKLHREVGPVLDGALLKFDLMNALNEFKRQEAAAAKLAEARRMLEAAGYQVARSPQIERPTPTEQEKA
jgi:hypothetical protein